MKRIIAAAILLVFSLSASAVALSATHGISDKVAYLAEALDDSLENESADIYQKTRELSDCWDSSYKILSTYISHQHLEETEKMIALLEKYVDMESYSLARVVCSEISKSIKHIYTSEKPELQNIF